MKRVVALGLLTCIAACNNGFGRHLSVSGQIEGVTVRAGSRTGGRVSEVLVQEGDAVKKGDILVRLEAHEAQARVAAAQAQLAQANALYTKLVNGARPEQIRQAEAAARQAEQRYQMALEGARTQEIEAARARAAALREKRDLAKTDLDRAKRLFDNGVVSRQVYDQAKHGYEAAEDAYQAAREELDLVIEGPRAEEIRMAEAAFDQAAAALEELRNGARAEDIEAARALCDAAQADLSLAETAANEMVVTAPVDGVVESLDVHPGDLVKPGPIVQIVDPEDLELMVYVSAKALGRLRLNQPVTLTTDSHGDETFDATIVYIASEGEFTPRNLQTEEERVRQVFGVKLKFDSSNGKLKAGMTATAHLELGTEGA